MLKVRWLGSENRRMMEKYLVNLLKVTSYRSKINWTNLYWGFYHRSIYLEFAATIYRAKRSWRLWLGVIQAYKFRFENFRVENGFTFEGFSRMVRFILSLNWWEPITIKAMQMVTKIWFEGLLKHQSSDGVKNKNLLIRHSYMLGLPLKVILYHFTEMHRRSSIYYIITWYKFLNSWKSKIS